MVINQTTIQGNSIITNVTYTLNDGTQVTVNVVTVNPTSAADVATDLANMEIEQGKEHDANLANIKAQLDGNVGQTVTAGLDLSGKMSLAVQAQTAQLKA